MTIRVRYVRLMCGCERMGYFSFIHFGGRSFTSLYFFRLATNYVLELSFIPFASDCAAVAL